MTLSIKIKSLKDFKNKNILIYMDRNVLKKKKKNQFSTTKIAILKAKKSIN